MPLAVIRADASPTIGGGHVVRCSALAEVLAARGWRCAIAGRAGTAHVASTVEAKMEVFDLDGPAAAEAGALRTRWPDGCDVLVVDHYKRDARFESSCRGWAKTVVAVDDLANRAHDCDLLVDSTYGRRASDYHGLIPSKSTILVDTGYTLLRSQFAKLRHRRRHAGAGATPRIFVSFGATDPGNFTALVVKALAGTGRKFAVDVVIGGMAPYLAEVRSLCSQASFDVTLHVDHSAVASVMGTATIAIGAAGSSAWERCCLGVPSILLAVASNQNRIAEAIVGRGAAIAIPNDSSTSAKISSAVEGLLGDTAYQERMKTEAANLCDGLGARRVADALDPPYAADGGAVRLRRATLDDSDIMLAWQQFPGMRRHSRNSSAPDAEGHRAWMAAKLADPDCVLQVVLHRAEPAGIVRLDRIVDEGGGDVVCFEVSVLVAPGCHGLGIGTAALACLRRMVPWAQLVAEVHPDNSASQALFLKAGYEKEQSSRFVARPTQ
jgi:UDP-2,4-diacetamido-2,4,6-trideoxy-beta-L-altropyranose hydrolase